MKDNKHSSNNATAKNGLSETDQDQPAVHSDSGSRLANSKEDRASEVTTDINKEALGSGKGRSSTTNGSKDHKESLLEKFFMDQLKDIYYAEQQLSKALPEISKACTTEELEDAFNDHLSQTQRHVKRLEKVFEIVGKKPEAKKCEAMDGILREVNNIISETKQGSMTRDAALIIAAQKVEHYEIASYGGLVQLAVTMNLRRAADLLDKTLNEEEQTDRLLTNIAEGHINMEAEDEGTYSWMK